MTERKNNVTLALEGVQLLFRNFAGREREYNSEGDRNFSVLLDPETAKNMIDAGWRVKQLKSREEDEPGDYHIKVNVNYKKGRPPRVVLVTSGSRTDMGAEEVEMLDFAEIKNADLVLNGWWSDMAGGGYSAFLKTAYITIAEDEFSDKYADIPTAGSKSTDDAPPPWNVEEE